MAARVQIEIEAKDSSSGILRAIAAQFGELGKTVSSLADMFGKSNELQVLYQRGLKDTAVSVADVARAEEAANAATVRFAEQAVTMLINGLKDAIKVTIEYAGEVRNLAMISGTTTEEASRLIQVLDDYKISADDVTAATRAMTKQGLAPSLETLGQLSDQYLQINDAQGRNEFIIKNLGRAGLQWVDVLQKGSKALTEQGAAVEKNLILSQRQVDAARENEIAVDRWTDAWTGFKVTIGNAVLPVMTSLLNGMSDTQRAEEILIEQGNQHSVNLMKMNGVMDAAAKAAYAQATAEREAADAAKMHTDAIDENAAALVDQELALKAAEEAMKAMSETNTGLLSLTTSLQAETETYTAKNEDLKNKLIELQTEQAKYFEGGKKYNELQGEIDGVTDAVKENEKAHQAATNKIVFNLLQQKMAVDGLSNAEFAALTNIGVKMGIFDQQTADMAIAMDEAATIITNNTDKIATDFGEPISKSKDFNRMLDTIAAKSGSAWDFYVNINVKGSLPKLPSLTYGGPRQLGGTVYAGGTYNVGEAGAEPFFPAVNGRILGHAESLHALSLGGGGGQTNYFYGNVTLQISEEASGVGIMSLR